MAGPGKDEKYTWADLLGWPEDVRYELIEGEPRLMSSPSLVHQGASMELSRQFAIWLTGKRCKVYASPADVMLFASPGDKPEDVDTVVVPDLFVVCDRSKLTSRGCMGAPDLVVEILSPSTGAFDRVKKMDLYEAAGVKEYWLLDPIKKKLVVCYLEDGFFRRMQVYIGASMVPVSVLDGLTIDLGMVFDATVV